MKNSVVLIALALFAAAGYVPAQTTQTASDEPLPPPPANYAVTTVAPHTWVQPNYETAPFSRLAFGGGVSTMGIRLQVAVIANRHIDLRGVGNFFNYSLNNVSVNGLLASGSANFSTAGASVDFYPFPNHGFRVSPGALFYNQNQVTSTVVAPGGTSFTLDGYTYYSSEANPVTGTGSVGLHTQSPAFSLTTGWGSMIPRRGGHVSFPLEIGAAFSGAPTVNLALTSGQVCTNPQGTVGCVNVVGNSEVQANLEAQQAKYQNDLNPFRIYPIFSTGIAFNFNLRSSAVSPAARPQ